MSVICPTGHRLVRWEVIYGGEGMDTHTLHMTRIGARFSRWLWSVYREQER